MTVPLGPLTPIVPAEQCQDLKATSKFVTYGWGMIPVQVQIGETK